MHKRKQFFFNAVILCVTSISLRLTGIFFNAFIVREIGAAGMGLFQLVMTVYLLFITFASSGIGMAATRLVTEALTASDYTQARAVLRKTFNYSAVMGSAACVAMLALAEHAGLKWLGDARTVRALQILAVSLPFIAMSSVLKGYFTAVRRVSKSSAVEVIEQLFRMAIIVYLIARVLPSGLENACVAIALGNSLAEALSFALLYIAYLLDRRRYRARELGQARPTKVYKIALPVAINAYLRAGFSAVSKLLVPATLQRSGLTKDDALAQYGMIHGMAFPVLQLPEMLLLSFATLLVPEFAEFHERRDERAITRLLGVVLRTTLLFAIGAIGVLSCFAKDLSVLVYAEPSAALYIASLAPLALFMYLDRVVDYALTGLNEQVNSMFNNLVESVLATVLILLFVPRYGIVGYMAVLFAGKAVNMWMSLTRLIRVSRVTIRFGAWVICPMVAMLTSIVLIALLRKALSWGWLLAMMLGLYALQLWLMGCFGEQDIAAPANRR